MTAAVKGRRLRGVANECNGSLRRPVSDDRDRLGEGPTWNGPTASRRHPRRQGALDRSGFGLYADADGRRGGKRRGSKIARWCALRPIMRSLLLVTRPSGRRSPSWNAIVRRTGSTIAAARCWASVGRHDEQRATGSAALYRMAPGEPMQRVLENTTVSNGLGWSPSGDRMYFVDSTEQRIDVFDFDEATGSISGRRCFARIADAMVCPTGLAVDAEGGVWLCLFGGGTDPPIRRSGRARRLWCCQ